MWHLWHAELKTLGEALDLNHAGVAALGAAGATPGQEEALCASLRDVLQAWREHQCCLEAMLHSAEEARDAEREAAADAQRTNNRLRTETTRTWERVRVLEVELEAKDKEVKAMGEQCRVWREGACMIAEDIQLQDTVKQALRTDLKQSQAALQEHLRSMSSLELTAKGVEHANREQCEQLSRLRQELQSKDEAFERHQAQAQESHRSKLARAAQLHRQEMSKLAAAQGQLKGWVGAVQEASIKVATELEQVLRESSGAQEASQQALAAAKHQIAPLTESLTRISVELDQGQQQAAADQRQIAGLLRTNAKLQGAHAAELKTLTQARQKADEEKERMQGKVKTLQKEAAQEMHANANQCNSNPKLDANPVLTIIISMLTQC